MPTRLVEMASGTVGWALISHPVRTVAAVIIVATSVVCPTVIASVAIAQTRLVLEQYAVLGHDAVIIEPEPVTYFGEQRLQPFTAETASRFLLHLDGVARSATLFRIHGQVKACGTLVPVTIVGVSPESRASLNASVERGRYLTSIDQRDSLPVVAVGRQLVADLSCIAREGVIGVSGRPMNVVGVIGGGHGGREGNLERAVLMPSATFARVYGNNVTPSMVIAELPDSRSRDRASLERVLRAVLRRGPSERTGVTITTFDEVHAAAHRTMSFVRAAVIGFMLIVTFGGALCTSSVIAITVSERMPEIGLRRAVGAKASLIVRQFLIEGAVVSSLGIAIAIVASWAMVAFAADLASVPMTLDWRSGAIAAAIATCMCQVTVWIAIRRPLGRNVAEILEA